MGAHFQEGCMERTAVTSSTTTNNHEDRDKDKKKERKSSSGTNTTELHINVWPFSWSRSAGSSGNQPKMAAEGQLLGWLVASLVYAVTQLVSTSFENGQVVLVEVESMWGGVAQFGKYGVEARRKKLQASGLECR
uniref:Uncharacterized protein n=1 Tax=Nelumbo nucifera TaxID=4432 RepID=A0A822XRM1_NELNU|nr:TPA_asm: hypothetical protein HUJ06_024430 [Nelumbo nucifera]